MKGFLAVILLSSLYTCAANTGHLLFSSGTQHAFRRWLGAPALAAVLAAAAGMALRKLLACGWVCGSAAFAAGRVGRRRLRYHSVPAGGMAAGGRKEAAALWAAHRPGDRKNRESLAADSNFLDILQCSEYNIKIGAVRCAGQVKPEAFPAKTAAFVPVQKRGLFVKDRKEHTAGACAPGAACAAGCSHCCIQLFILPFCCGQTEQWKLPGGRITVSFCTKTCRGSWRCTLPAFCSGGLYSVLWKYAGERGI